MDPIPLVFYATICGLLSALAPNFGSALPRLAIGAFVGLVAASVLPSFQALVGG